MPSVLAAYGFEVADTASPPAMENFVWTTTGGTITNTATNANPASTALGAARCLRLNHTATASQLAGLANTRTAPANFPNGTYTKIAMCASLYVAALPSVAATNYIFELTVAAGSTLAVDIRSNGNVIARCGSGSTTIGTCANGDRLTIYWVADVSSGTSSSAICMQINGGTKTAIGTATLVQTATSFTGFRIGSNQTTSLTYDLYVDDVVLWDNGSGTWTADQVPNVVVVPVDVDSVPADIDTGWTIGAGSGSRAAQCDERPWDDLTTYITASSNAATQHLPIKTFSLAGHTLYAVGVETRHGSNGTTGTRNFTVELDTAGAATTGTLYTCECQINGWRSSTRYAAGAFGPANNAPGGAAWSQSGFDACRVKLVTGGTGQVNLSGLFLNLVLSADVTGTTYQKSGVAAAGGRADGADAATFARAGTSVAGGRVAGADAATFVRLSTAAAGGAATGVAGRVGARTGVVVAGGRVYGQRVPIPWPAAGAYPSPLLYPWLPPGGPHTYTKTGVVVAGGLVIGADAIVFGEVALAAAGGRAAGADVWTAVEAGTGAAGAAAVGADVATFAEAGVAAAGGRADGTDAVTFAETGAPRAGGVATGADATTFTEAGSAASGGVASGADSTTYTEAGVVAGGTILVGADAMTWGKSGSAAAGGVAAGVDAVTFVEAGLVRAGTVAVGVAVRLGNTTKIGTFAAGTVVVGVRVVTFSRAGTGVAGAVAAGADAVVFAESGTGASGTRADGVDASTYNRAGTVQGGTAVVGADAVFWAEAVLAAAGGVAAGVDAVTWVEASRAAAGAVAIGVAVTQQSQTIKLGTVRAGTAAAGDDATTFVESGKMLAGTVAAGVRLREIPRTGLAQAGARLSGVRATQHDRAGSAAAGGMPVGVRVVQWTRSGKSVAGAAAVGLFLRERTVVRAEAGGGAREHVTAGNGRGARVTVGRGRRT